MSFGALQMKATITIMPVASSVPSFVQGTQANTNGTAGGLPVTLASAPTSGNQLFAVVSAGASSAIQTPVGWTVLGTCAGSSRVVVFGKVSNGSEQTTTFTVASGTPALGAEVTEWSGAKAGAFASSTSAQASSPVAFGPTGAPVSPNAVPLVFVIGTIALGGMYTWSSGWTGNTGATTTQYSNPFYAYQATPPNASVSGSLTINRTVSGAQWCSVWVEPK